MTVRILSLLLFSSLSLVAYSQNSRIDSLLSLAEIAKTDSSLIGLYSQLSKESIDIGDSTQAFHHAYLALKLAENVGDKHFLAMAYNNLGYSHLSLMHSDSTKYYYFKTLNILKNDTSISAKKMIFTANNNLACIYSLDGNMKKMLSLIIANLPFVHELQDEEKYKATIHNVFGSFQSMGEYEKAYPYMQEAVAVADKGNFTEESKTETYMSAGLLLLNMDSLDQIGSLLRKSLPHLKKSGNHRLWGIYYTLHARYLSKLNKTTEARKNLNMAWEELKNSKDWTTQYEFYSALVDVERNARNFKPARDAAFKLYAVNSKNQYHNGILEACKEIATLSTAIGDYTTAYRYMEEYSLRKDSIDNHQNLMDINELEVQYRTSEKEREITQLEIEKKETDLTQRNQRLLNWLFGIGAAISLLALIFAAYIYRNRQRQIASELQELEQQKQLELTQAVLEGEERERQRIARDLQDGLGGMLSGIKIKLSGEQKQSTTPVIEETILQLEDSIGELRRIARNMMPETLIRSGLEVALRDLCVSLSSDETIIEFQPNALDRDMPVQSQVNIYRIIQELLTNAIRHGQASKIIVQYIQDQRHILITVEDNGQGMDHQKSPASNGIGLNNVQNRVDLMKGRMDIESASGHGMTVHIELNV